MIQYIPQLIGIGNNSLNSITLNIYKYYDKLLIINNKLYLIVTINRLISIVLIVYYVKYVL